MKKGMDESYKLAMYAVAGLVLLLVIVGFLAWAGVIKPPETDFFGTVDLLIRTLNPNG